MAILDYLVDLTRPGYRLETSTTFVVDFLAILAFWSIGFDQVFILKFRPCLRSIISFGFGPTILSLSSIGPDISWAYLFGPNVAQSSFLGFHA